jgi:hypothetical protein
VDQILRVWWFESAAQHDQMVVLCGSTTARTQWRECAPLVELALEFVPQDRGHDRLDEKSIATLKRLMEQRAGAQRRPGGERSGTVMTVRRGGPVRASTCSSADPMPELESSRTAPRSLRHASRCLFVTPSARPSFVIVRYIGATRSGRAIAVGLRHVPKLQAPPAVLATELPGRRLDSHALLHRITVVNRVA